jgi:hypothetical protein
MQLRSSLPLILFAALFLGCASPPPAEPATPASGRTSRPALTSEQCEARAGTVVGDIGDGATQRPDYVCPSGSAPIGSISSPPGGPVNIEGAVCCPAP